MSPTLTSVSVSTASGQAVSSSSALVVSGVNQAIVAQGLDQFGCALATQPSFTWWTTTVPSGAPTPTVATHGASATETFGKAGTYGLAVQGRTATGISVTRSVSMTLAQMVSGVKNAPTAAVNTWGTSATTGPADVRQPVRQRHKRGAGPDVVHDIASRQCTYTVRFYTGTYGVSGYASDGGISAGFNNNVATADYVTVDRMLPTGATGTLAYADYGANYANAGNSLWIPLIEKAYAQWNQTGKEGRDGQNAYASIQGGWMATVNAQVLGHNATDYIMTTTGEQVAINALTAKKAVTIGTNSSPACRVPNPPLRRSCHPDRRPWPLPAVNSLSRPAGRVSCSTSWGATGRCIRTRCALPARYMAFSPHR